MELKQIDQLNDQYENMHYRVTGIPEVDLMRFKLKLQLACDQVIADIEHDFHGKRTNQKNINYFIKDSTIH